MAYGPGPGGDDIKRKGGKKMYVYLRSGANLYTVGFFTPSGEWIAESDWDSRESAALRVHWLNGGGETSDNIND